MSGKISLDLTKNSFDPFRIGGLLDIDILGTNLNTVFFTVLFYLLSIFLIIKMSKYNVIDLKRSLYIFSLHTIISTFFIVALMTLIVNDIDSYFQIGLIFPNDGFEEFFPFTTWGILTIAQIYRAFFYYLNLDFLSINIFFGCIGSFILIFYDKLLLNNIDIKNSKKNIYSLIFLFLVFFPSLSVWSGFLGKEVVTLLILIFAAFIIIKIEKKSQVVLYLIPLISLLAIIRPHFAFFFILSFSIYLILKLVKNNFSRICIILFFFILSLYIGQIIIGGSMEQGIFGLLDSFFEAGATQRRYSAGEVRYYAEWGNAHISKNIFVLYFSFLFSPIVNFETARNIALSAENTVLALIMMALIFNTDFKKLYRNDESKFFLLFFVISTFVMSLFTYQIGIYWRQKWLFLPYFFIGMSLIQKTKYFDAKK